MTVKTSVKIGVQVKDLSPFFSARAKSHMPHHTFFHGRSILPPIFFQHILPRATVMVSPLTPLDSSDARKAITSATSSGVTTRPAG